MGNRGRVLKKIHQTDNYVLVDIDEENKQPVLTQEELLQLESKLFNYDMNLQGTYGEDELRNEVVIINER